MSICAYCQKDEKPTKEHIIPDFIYKYERQYNKIYSWNEKTPKLIQGEFTVNDVCTKCNNNQLSQLDTYAKEILSKHNILNQCFKEKKIIFYYDYNKLLRWILKLLFNSSRCTNSNPEIFEKYTPYILDRSPLKNDKDIYLFAEILKPFYMPEELNDSKIKKKINPFSARIQRMVDFDPAYSVRFIIIGALIFHIIIFRRDIKNGFREARVRKYKKHMKNIYLIDREKTLSIIKQGNRTFLDIHKNSYHPTEDKNIYSAPMSSLNKKT